MPATPKANCAVAIVQAKPRKGDLKANFAELESTFSQLIREGQPDLIILPETAMTGYFLEGAVYDLALSAGAFAEMLAAAWHAAGGNGTVDIACGFYENDNGTFYNSALYLSVRPDGHNIVHVHRKMFLATYGVFDEERFLSRGRKLSVFQTRFGTMALLICEDVWHSIMPTIAALKGARFVIVVSAAPGRGIEGEGELESIAVWRALLCGAAAEHGVYLMYAGLTGFEGGKGMTGSSSIIDPRGKIVVQAPAIGACIVRAKVDMREIDLARASLPL
ncbi:MAG: beta-ureidopropionase, partial [Candidatus Eremiobacteraeota bacterium]|nr:beta-ureidopropionase [Candidatus Eremiobacteraeota bacterium]